MWTTVDSMRSLSRSIPRAEDLFDSVRGAKFFTKMDLHSGYFQVRMRKEDIHKTTISTPFGTFAFTVMSMGLTNAPATLSRLMNSILQPFLRKFIVVYLDDLLIYSNSWEEHMQHLRAVLAKLREHKLYAKPSKCTFATPSVSFLGHKISGTTLSIEEEKVAAIKSWPVPKDSRGVRAFLGFCSYLRRFVEHYTQLARPLEVLTGKNVAFVWGKEQQQSFEGLQKALMTAPVLSICDPSAPKMIFTDASDIAIGGVLLQREESGDHWLT